MRYNHLAVIVSAIAFFAFGAIWYTVFGEVWHTGVGKTAAELSALGAAPYIMSLGLSVIMAYGIATALDLARATTWQRGANVAAFLALVLFGTITLLEYGYEGRPLAPTLINIGYGIIGAAIIGAIEGAWRIKKVAA